MTRSRREGLTLIETLVVVLIFAIILGVLAELFRWGLRAHRKGEAVRKATVMAREIASHLSAQIGTGVTLAPFSPDVLSGVQKDFQSAVLWPDCFSDNYSAFVEPFYRRERTNTTLPSGTVVANDLVHNRLIFTRPGKAAGQAFEVNDYSQFVHVEYLVVAADNVTGLGQNKLYRRLYKVAASPTANPVGVILVGPTRTIDPNLFVLDPVNPLNNPYTTTNSSTEAQKAEQGVVFELPGERDQISFTVEHTQYVSNTGQQPPRVPAFDPSLFTVTVTVNIDKQDGFLGTQTLTEQARVRSGN